MYLVQFQGHEYLRQSGTREIGGTCIKAVLSDDEGMGQKAHRNPACIMPRCTGEDH